MAFTGNYATNALIIGLPSGAFALTTSSTDIYVALYTNAATLNADTAVYTTTGEVVASGYTAGGSMLTVSTAPTVGGSGTTSYFSFDPISWASAITARGALVYQNSGAFKTLFVLDFGSDKISTSTFTITFPPATNTTAIVRIGS